MKCKRIAPSLLAFLLPLSLAVLVGMGCGGSNNVVVPEPPLPEPMPSGVAGLSNLTLSVGELRPAFREGETRYTAKTGVLSESSVQVTATLKDPKATLTINGAAAVSGVAKGVSLPIGSTLIKIVSVSEDAKSYESIELTMTRLALNTKVWVLNGIAGAPVDNTVLKLTDSRGRALDSNVGLPRSKNGTALLWALDPAERYNIYATGDDVAAACYANFDPSKEDTAALYCYKTSTDYYEKEPPVIDSIAFATANTNAADWKVMPFDAHYVGTAAGAAAVRVTAITRNPISVNIGNLVAAYVPMRVNIDEMASLNSGGSQGATGTAIETNVAIQRDGKTYYRTTYRFATPLLAPDVFSKERYLSVVVFDLIGNRTEQRVFMTITDSAALQASDPDLSNVAPTIDLGQSQTHMTDTALAGRSGDQCGPSGPAECCPGESGDTINAMDPIDPAAYFGIQQTIIQFGVRADGSAANLGIRGYEVYRSLGNENNFVKIATVHFAALSATAPQYIDRTPSLAEGVAYYKIRAFNGNQANHGFSRESASFRVPIMPPTMLRLSDSYDMVSKKLWPTFRFRVTNPKLMDKNVSDVFRFLLYVKNPLTAAAFKAVPFAMDFRQCDSIENMPGDTLNVVPGAEANTHRYGFKAGRPTVKIMRVTTYTAATTSANAILNGTWYFASDEVDVPDGEDEEGNPKTKKEWQPFSYLDDNGDVVINADSPIFRTYGNNSVGSNNFVAGVVYPWCIYGNTIAIDWNSGTSYPFYMATFTNTVGAWFYKGFNTNGTTYLACCYSSTASPTDYVPTDGYYYVIIDPDAK